MSTAERGAGDCAPAVAVPNVTSKANTAAHRMSGKRIAAGALPRIYGLFKGRVDPRLAEVSTLSRWSIAATYFVIIIAAVAGAVASHVQLPTMSAT